MNIWPPMFIHQQCLIIVQRLGSTLTNIHDLQGKKLQNCMIILETKSENCMIVPPFEMYLHNSIFYGLDIETQEYHSKYLKQTLTFLRHLTLFCRVMQHLLMVFMIFMIFWCMLLQVSGHLVNKFMVAVHISLHSKSFVLVDVLAHLC